MTALSEVYTKRTYPPTIETLLSQGKYKVLNVFKMVGGTIFSGKRRSTEVTHFSASSWRKGRDIGEREREPSFNPDRVHIPDSFRHLLGKKKAPKLSFQCFFMAESQGHR